MHCVCRRATRLVRRIGRRRFHGLHSDEQVTAVLGSQWGDEGKGKLVDILAQNYDVVCRFNGGSNAGHTLYVDGQKFAMHLLPCGVLQPSIENVIGNGVVVHVPTLVSEIQALSSAGVSCADRLRISDRAHIVFDFHILIDGMIEDQWRQSVQQGGDGSIGTTRRGIGPAYASKMYRKSLRMGDLRDWKNFERKYEDEVAWMKSCFGFDLNSKEELRRFQEDRDFLLPMITDTASYLNKAFKSGSRILAEGANACMLDVDHGTYPWVTSSSTTVGGMFTGLGVSPKKLNTTIGVVKAYTTRVGLGPFPTEQTNSVGKHLGKVGNEFGTTTGRARRCGWLDIPVLQYSNLINGYDSLNITKLDVLNDVDEIEVGVAYKLHGDRLPYGAMPSTPKELGEVEVEYETVRGWNCDISGCKSYDELPLNAKKYIEKIEELVGVRVSWIGVGAERDAMVKKGF